jgi:hypothetical protein
LICVHLRASGVNYLFFANEARTPLRAKIQTQLFAIALKSLDSVKIQSCGIRFQSLRYCPKSKNKNFIRQPKTGAVIGDRPMLFVESYAFFYSWLVQ